MARRKVIALLSALQLLCTNTFVYASCNTNKQFVGALMEQPSSSPKIRNNDENFKLLMEDVKKKQKQIEQEQKERLERQEQEKQNKVKQLGFSRGGEIQDIDLTLSFYDNTYTNLTASGCKIYYGVVASNNLPLGTEIYIAGWGMFKVLDTGSNALCRQSDGSIKIDVYVERLKGESIRQYRQRLMNMGLVKTKGYLVR
jgi:3D (Asp-Asp-Asp) domain-containing protein